MLKKKYFYPEKVNDLIRIGNNFDGGYIFKRNLIKKMKNCISFGLGDDFSFEIELKKINNKINIYTLDHSINYIFWIKHFFYWLWKSIRFRKYLKFLSFIKYILFFHIDNNVHLKIKVGEKNNNLKNIIKRLKINTNTTLLKIDIDGDEYKIIDEIKNYEFLGLIIEFEKLNKNIKKVENFIKKNKNLKLIHIHGNNFSPIINNLPDSVELSFVNKKLINVAGKNETKYPMKDLDFPNNIMKKDIELIFKK